MCLFYRNCYVCVKAVGVRWAVGRGLLTAGLPRKDKKNSPRAEMSEAGLGGR